MSEEQGTRDIVLAPNEYMYIQDVTKGQIKTLAGPTVANPSPQERPVIYDADNAKFRKVTSLDAAVRTKAIAVEGYYLVLKNPAAGDKVPDEGQNAQSPDLLVGRKVNIPGPAHFALWPGQDAEYVKGHNLRSNEYLIGRVYNEEEARKNWRKAVIKPATGAETTGTDADTSTSVDPADAKPPKPPEVTEIAIAAPDDLSVGREFIIRGTDVSFYIPPTGISVVKGSDGKYVRQAVTLERLEYAVLVDENGRKRFEEGPQVVFPAPTETFRTDKKGNRKFRVIELNELQGIHVKVTAPYKEDDGTERKLGDELFITGKDTAIYMPREEHSIVTYDGNTKHFAVQIPAGEARYVMNRMTGEIRKEVGPKQLLCDPRYEVLVRRVLSDKQCERWYPGNQEALEYNRLLRQIQAQSPTTRAGTVSEGDVARGYRKLLRQVEQAGMPRGGPMTKGLVSNYASSNVGEALMDQSALTSNQHVVGDEFTRGADYTEPRSVTPVTKFKGVPAVEVWTGYAVKVVSKRGQRRVEIGPKNLLLDYDESLEVLELSTGKPKTTDHLLKTVYLRVANNKISDIQLVETLDHVNVRLKLSLRVGFEGDPNKWFDVENYVKYLCDHVRSVLKGVARRIPVEEFYEGAVDIIRDTILGPSVEDEDGNKSRPGMVFKENGMRVTDVEVLTVKIADDRVASLLQQAQHDVVQGHITVRQEEQKLAITRRREELTRERHDAQHLSLLHKLKLDSENVAKTLELNLTQFAADAKRTEQQKLLAEAEELVQDVAHKARLARESEAAEQRIGISEAEQKLALELLAAETQTAVARMQAIQPGLVEALTALGDKETLVKVAQAWNYQHVIGGKSLPDGIGQIFKGTPVGKIVDRLANGNGVNTAPTTPTKPAPRA